MTSSMTSSKFFHIKFYLTSVCIKYNQPEVDTSYIAGVIEKWKSYLHIILLSLDIVSPGNLVVCAAMQKCRSSICLYHQGRLAFDKRVFSYCPVLVLISSICTWLEFVSLDSLYLSISLGPNRKKFLNETCYILHIKIWVKKF